MTAKTLRLTMAQALVRYLCNQFTEIDGGAFRCLRASSRSSGMAMSHAFPKPWKRCRTDCRHGAGRTNNPWRSPQSVLPRQKAQADHGRCDIDWPGALNMVTAAGVAMANRLPVLLLAGDTFASRLPDPVLQQVEHFGDPTLTVNDAFKSVVRYWDRIVLPEQLLQSLPQAVATMLDPADCGPAFIGLAQDTQEIAFDYPAVF